MVQLAFDQTGSGPLVVLVHGITENRHSWDPLMDQLAETHRVLRVDLRGHGDSPTAETYDITELAADIEPLVDELPLMVGHSLGGNVVTAYAAQFPTRGVVNIDQSLNLTPMQAGLKEQEPLLRGEAFPLVIDALFNSLRGQVNDAQWHRLSELRKADPDVVLGIWGVMLDTTPEELTALVDSLTSGIETPYLALNGFDLGPDYQSWLTERIPGAVVETWDGVGHYPHLVRPDQFLERLAAFEATL